MDGIALQSHLLLMDQTYLPELLWIGVPLQVPNSIRYKPIQSIHLTPRFWFLH